MPASPPLYRIAADRSVLVRATLTSLGVGTLLTLVNHGDRIQAGTMGAGAALPIAVTYVVPFLVSLGSSVIALRLERRSSAVTTALLEHEIAAINRFPGQNPNPVMRVTEDGLMTFANASSAPVRAALGVEVGTTLDGATLARIRTAAAATPPETFEATDGHRTFQVLSVHIPELGAYNVYGTDITAAKVVARFPDKNTNPVLRMSPDGRLTYANPASMPIARALGLEVGAPVPAGLLADLQASLADPPAPAPEVPAEGGRTFRLSPVLIPEFDFVNLYGTELTAEKAIDRIPTQNPNPVMRLSRTGKVTFANPASALVRQALGATVGAELDPAVFARILTAGDDAEHPTLEVEAEGRIFRLRVVSMYEYDAINVYGTDITAARQVEVLSAANERLLLNILPPSIAERLRGGETVIADRFDDMAVLFADVVGFTTLSARLSPVEVIDLLNRVFTMCDELAERFGLEKIKTIGDAYMVAAGLPEPRPDHRASGRPLAWTSRSGSGCTSARPWPASSASRSSSTTSGGIPSTWPAGWNRQVWPAGSRSPRRLANGWPRPLNWSAGGSSRSRARGPSRPGSS
ncbi:MAG: Guanylate cyclase protein [Chloroflexi bacterium]|nr:Guanylate cyclase protein [Chloroflexota bacterium]